MSRIIVEGPRSYHVAQPAEVVVEDREVAWASAHVSARPDFGWVLGRFVEADNANENGHIFGLDDLKRVHPSIVSTPLNMLHRAHHVVGHFTATNLLVPNVGVTDVPLAAGEVNHSVLGGPTTTAYWSDIAGNLVGSGTLTSPVTARSDGLVANPYVEALAAFWRWVFPDEYRSVAAAYEEGSLFFSMEAVPRSLSCELCGGEFPYAGARSEVYCDHLNAFKSQKILNDPHFVGGAMIIPPTRPGWRKADITELAGLVEANMDAAGELYDQVAAAAPQLRPDEWEGIMAELLVATSDGDIPLRARTFALESRLADLRGPAAMANGSFVIEHEADLRRAVAAFGPERSDRGPLKRHIIARARHLDMVDLIPHTWADTLTADVALDDAVLEAYVKHLTAGGWDLDDPPAPAATQRALPDGSALWQLSDGWGEWYFHEAAEITWVAQKMADVGAYATAEHINLTKSDVVDLGWGDKAWLDELERRMGADPAGE